MIIGLDAGHGLHTAGKQTLNGSKGVIKEWVLNNAVCKEIERILQDYDVTVIRTDDTTGKVDRRLDERVAISNAYGCDVLLSIHHNAGGGTGIEVYYHTHGTDEDKRLASVVASKLAKRTMMKNRGVKHKKFSILNCRATAVLVEGGFMDSEHDYYQITSEYGQRAYAIAVVESLEIFFGLKKINYNVADDYLVRVTCNLLNVRERADFSSKIVGTVKKGEVFTIVEFRNGLGRLKSGAGWISMSSLYTERVQISK